MNKKSGIKVIVKNKRAFYDYAISKTLEAGLVLKGTEVKTLREGKAQISESFVTIDKNKEAWLHNINIPHYHFGNINNHQETRKRKLLISKKEIEQLDHEVNAKGLTIVAISLYFKSSLVKIEIGLGKGKKAYDKRQDQAKKDFKKRLNKGQLE